MRKIWRDGKMITDLSTFKTQCKQFPHGDALIECIEIWAERQPKYGNGWTQNKEYQMMGLICEKFRRLEVAFETPETENIYELKEEILRDLINWSLFYLQNLKDGKYKNRNN